MLTISELGLKRGAKCILDNLTLKLDREIFGVLGVNGAGKTSLMECIAQELSYSGSITFNDLSFKAWTSLHQRRFSVIYDKPIVYDFLSIDEYVSFILNILGETVSASVRARFYDGFGLGGYKDSQLRTLSFGNKRKAYMVPYLLVERHLMLLDEPTNGLDTQGRLFLEHTLKHLCLQGCAILVSSHDIDFLTRVSDRVGILAGGALKTVVFRGSFLGLEEIYIKESGLMFQ